MKHFVIATCVALLACVLAGCSTGTTTPDATAAKSAPSNQVAEPVSPGAAAALNDPKTSKAAKDYIKSHLPASAPSK